MGSAQPFKQIKCTAQFNSLIAKNLYWFYVILQTLQKKEASEKIAKLRKSLEVKTAKAEEKALAGKMKKVRENLELQNYYNRRKALERQNCEHYKTEGKRLRGEKIVQTEEKA